MSTNEDVAVNITLTGSDTDGDTLTYSVVNDPTNGTLSGTAPNLTYTPNDNYNGADSFTFTVNDGNTNSAPATVSITVNQTYSVTFSVDTNNVNLNGETPTIAGSFNGWCTTCDLLDVVEGSDGIYTKTIKVSNGYHEYKFTTTSDSRENIIGDCTENNNRHFTVNNADLVLPINLWNICGNFEIANNNPKLSSYLRIGTYNIKLGSGQNSNIGYVIDTSGMDIIVLQEAGGFSDIVTEANKSSFLQLINLDPSKYDCLLLNAQETDNEQDLAMVFKKSAISNIDSLTTTRLEITSGGLRDAMLVSFKVNIEGTLMDLNVINVHLDAGLEDGQSRLNLINKINEKYEEEDIPSKENVIIAGDFNWFGTRDGLMSSAINTDGEWIIYPQDTFDHLDTKKVNGITRTTNSTDQNANLFFSGYCEGSSNNKYLEIYNPTNETKNLDDYAFPNASNGSNGNYEYWNSFTTGATIAPGDVYIIAHGSADQSILDKADQTFQYLSNGDDGYALVKKLSGATKWGNRPSWPHSEDPAVEDEDFEVLDWIGNWNADPGSGWTIGSTANATQNKTLVRKNVIKGNSNPFGQSGSSQVTTSTEVTGSGSDQDSAYKALINNQYFGINADPILLDNNQDILASQHNTTTMLEWSTNDSAVPPHSPNIQQYASSIYQNKLIARLDCLMLGSGIQSTYVQNSYKVIGNPFDHTSTNFSTDNVNSLKNISDHLPVYIDLVLPHPIITSEGLKYINENNKSNQNIYTATSNMDNVQFSLVNGSDSDLTIDSVTGIVTLLGSLNKEIKEEYNFRLTATDTFGNVSDEFPVRIIVNDIDDESPFIVSGFSTNSITEFTGEGQLIYKAIALDPDSIKADIRFKLIPIENHENDIKYLKFNSITGEVTLKINPNYEKKSKYEFGIQAVDLQGNKSVVREFKLNIRRANVMLQISPGFNNIVYIKKGWNLIGTSDASILLKNNFIVPDSIFKFDNGYQRIEQNESGGYQLEENQGYWIKCDW